MSNKHSASLYYLKNLSDLLAHLPGPNMRNLSSIPVPVVQRYTEKQQNSALASTSRKKYSGEGITPAHNAWSNVYKSETETSRSVTSI